MICQPGRFQASKNADDATFLQMAGNPERRLVSHLSIKGQTLDLIPKVEHTAYPVLQM